MSQSVQKKDPAFYRQMSTLFEKHYQLMYRAALSITGSPEDADDVVQSAFLKLLQRQAGTDFVQNPAGYLYCSAMHAAFRMRSRRQRESDNEDVNSVEIPAPAVETHDALDRAEAALKRLKPEQVELLLLRYKEGLSRREIANKLGKSVGAVAMELLRVKAKLKRLLRNREGQRETQTERRRGRKPVFSDAAQT